MTSLQFKVETKSSGDRLSKILDGLSGPGRTRIAKAMEKDVRGVIVNHLSRLGETRHDTANRLGATPTGYIVNLAENFDQYSAVEVNEQGVLIVMDHPTIARAFRDIFIRAKKHFLTIPMNAAAYGHRATEFAKVIFLHRSRGGSGKTRRQKPIPANVPIYMLVASVLQKRDPSLFPAMSA